MALGDLGGSRRHPWEKGASMNQAPAMHEAELVGGSEDGKIMDLDAPTDTIEIERPGKPVITYIRFGFTASGKLRYLWTPLGRMV